MQQRYTLDGDAALESHLDGVCERVRERVLRIFPKRMLQGILLGGGYGYGEGGVLKTPDGDLPHAEMEFYIFVAGSVQWAEHRFSGALEELAQSLEGFAGVELKFKILSIRGCIRAPASLGMHELVSGHRVVFGRSDLLAGCERHRNAADIPVQEATSLLLQRGSSLLFAWERLQRFPFSRADGEFVLRSTAEAKLAVGDAFLTTQGRYHASVHVRDRLMRKLRTHSQGPGAEAVMRSHAEGVAFRLHPEFCRDRTGVLWQQLQGAVRIFCGMFLWVEQQRLGVPFAGLEEYRDGGLNKCPEKPWWRNVALNLGLRIRSRARFRGGWLEHPRQRLLHGLSAMLWGVGEADVRLRPDAAVWPRLEAELGRPCATFSAALRAYEELWRRLRSQQT